jgi:phage-related protein
MSISTFPAIKPTYGQRKTSAPKVRTISFGDGYEHRLNFGLTQHLNPKVYQFTFNVSETDADIIEAFLDARANAAGKPNDSDSFDFTPPGEPVAQRFVCESWNKSIPFNNRATIQATFREVFEP